MSDWRGAVVDSCHIFRDMLKENLCSFGYDIILAEKSIGCVIEKVKDQQSLPFFVLWHSPPDSDIADDLNLVRDFHRKHPSVLIFLLTDIPHHDRGVWQTSADITHAGIARVLSRDIPGAALKYMLALALLEQQPPQTASDEEAPVTLDPSSHTFSERRPDGIALPDASSIRRRDPDVDAPLPLQEKGLGLSDREHQILACLAEGHANKTIGRMLNITEGTVKVHIKSLLRKLKVRNRTQAAIWALDHSASALLLPPHHGVTRSAEQGETHRVADSWTNLPRSAG
jgi:DNA-binding NarL/FixJ family response regulator